MQELVQKQRSVEELKQQLEDLHASEASSSADSEHLHSEIKKYETLLRI